LSWLRATAGLPLPRLTSGFGFGCGSGAALAEPPLTFPGAGDAAAIQSGAAGDIGARIADCLLHPGERYDYDGKKCHLSHIRLV
jgi:hypothetical protein